LKNIKNKIRHIKNGLHQVGLSAKERYADELYGKPPNDTANGEKVKGTNFTAIEKIHRLAGK
jgi:hypothetical protein